MGTRTVVAFRNEIGKTCTKCGAFKYYSEYSPQRVRSKDGLKPWCKKCMSANAKEWVGKHPDQAKETSAKWYELNKERVSEKNKDWVARNIEKVRKIKRAWEKRNPEYIAEKGRRRRAKYPERFKEQDRKHNQQYYSEHTDSIKEQNRRWKKEHPEQVRELNRKKEMKDRGRDGHHTLSEFEWLKNITGNKCLCCLSVDRRLTRDHIDPNGSDYIENIQPLCQPCNSRKLNRIIVDYRPQWLIDNFKELKFQITHK